jgi:hypothetical protein
MTDDAGVVLGVGPSPPASALPAAAHMGTGASAEQQASCLITSCTRKLEKRKAAGAAEAGPAHAQLGAAGSAPSSAHTAPQQLVRSNSKRSKGDALVQQQQQQQQQQPAAFSSGSDTAVYMDDQACAPHARPQQQELLQLLAAQQQGTGSRPEQQQQAACSTLGSMLAPLYAWVPARSSSLDERQRCSTGPRSARSAPAQEEDEHLEGDEDGDGAWLDENLACSEGRLTSPSTSGTPSCVSVPHSTAGTAPHKQQLQQQQPSSGAAASGAGVQASVPSGSGATCAAAHVADGDGAAVVVSSGRNCADEPTDDADFDEDDFDPFLFIGSLGPVEAYAPPGRQPLLPRQTRACKQKTLVLDLDETLVHSTLEPCGAEGADFSFQVTFNGCDHMVHVRTRPHMQAFLERCAALFEVVVFTASQKVGGWAGGCAGGRARGAVGCCQHTCGGVCVCCSAACCCAWGVRAYTRCCFVVVGPPAPPPPAHAPTGVCGEAAQHPGPAAHADPAPHLPRQLRVCRR